MVIVRQFVEIFERIGKRRNEFGQWASVVVAGYAGLPEVV
jgi:hypothetical protein